MTIILTFISKFVLITINYPLSFRYFMKFLHRVSNYYSLLAKKMFQFFENIDAKKTSIYAVILMTIGQIANYYNPFNNFNIYQFLFLLAIIIASWSIKDFLVGIKKFNEMTASQPIRFVGINFLKLLSSNWVILGILIIGGFFMYSTIKLKFIEFNPSGVYAGIIIVFVMITAVMGYTVYIYYIILLERINMENDFKYNFYMPAKTEWVIHLAKKGRRLNNAFFVLGFIYTLVYYLNSPKDVFTVKGCSLDEIFATISNNSIFIASWVVIFLIIIVAFPVLYIWQVKLIEKLIRKLKDISINNIYLLMKAEKLTMNDNIDEELKYFTLISNIDISEKYPIQTRDYIPLISSLSTIGVHLIKISESLV